MRQKVLITTLLLISLSVFYGNTTKEDNKFLGNVLASNIRGTVSDEIFLKYWNQVTVENSGKWGSVESRRNSPYWVHLDNLYQYCIKNKIPFKQHTFIWGSQQPGWIKDLPPVEQRKEVEEWIRSFCKRYPKVAMIDVVNEPISFPPKQYLEALGGKGETGWDWVIWAFEKTRRYAPNATLILNEHSILISDEKLWRFSYIIRLLKEKKLIDAIGLQGHFLESTPAIDIKRRLNGIAALQLPVYISEFEINIADDTTQKEKYETIFPIFWQHQAVKGVTLWGYKENQIWRKNGYLLRKDGSERPAMQWLQKYLLENK